jgi:hypothetical protein
VEGDFERGEEVIPKHAGKSLVMPIIFMKRH